MRVKFKETIKCPELEYGKTYDIVLFACSFWWQITFTRKNHLFVKHMHTEGFVDGIPIHKVSGTFKISKRKLKRLLKDSFCQVVFELED